MVQEKNFDSCKGGNPLESNEFNKVCNGERVVVSDEFRTPQAFLYLN